MSLDKIGGIFCLCRLKEFFVGNKCRHTVFLQSNSLIFFFTTGKKTEKRMSKPLKHLTVMRIFKT